MGKIKITIHTDGTQHVEALCVVGEECRELTRALEDRLGRQAGERELKPEYYEREQVTESDRESEGA